MQADNLVANKDGVAECRRGQAAVGTSIGITIQQIYSYQDHLLEYAIGGLYYEVGFTWTLSGSISLPSTWGFPTGYYANFIRENEANKNFYFCTQFGIYKIDAYNAPPIPAGVPPALDGTGVLSGSGSGFLGAMGQCVYQIVFGYTDLNGNLNLGAPSQRILVVNSTGGADNVDLTFTVPQGLSTNYFYQIYRTPQTTYSATPSANIPPGAELQLAAQYQLTGGEISGLSVTYTDVTTDELLRATLYTSPSQEGALQANDRPPFSNDACFFSQMMFYANCFTLQSTSFSLISVGSPNGIQVGDTVVINGVTFTGALSQNNATQDFEISSGGTVSEDIDTTARNLIACVNANASTTDVYAQYLSGYNDLPGLVGLTATDFTLGAFYVTSSRGSAFSPVLPSSGSTFGSSNDTTPNGIYVSKVGQPEAVPAVNLNFVGGGDQPIYRILPLRDRVIVLKSDGVYVITGTTPETLSITLLDSTIVCIAPESARLLNNSVYCLTQQGVVSITESGVTIQSRQIEGDLLALTTPAYSAHFPQVTATSYETERLYILNMPSETTDTYPTQAFCYNWITNAWTRWPISMAYGFVNPANNLLYTSRPDAQDGYIYQERKNYAYSDFMDDQTSVLILSVDSTGLVITLSGAPLAEWVGYGLEQTDVGIAIITAIDAVGHTITLDLQDSTTPGDVLAWVAGAAFIDVPIPVDLVFAPITAGFPHYMKNWGRTDFWFNRGNFQRIEAGFISEISGQSTENIQAILTGLYGFGPFGGGPYGGTINDPQVIQTLIPTANTLSRWIEPTLHLSFPQARLSCLGVTVSYDIVSDVSG